MQITLKKNNIQFKKKKHNDGDSKKESKSNKKMTNLLQIEREMIYQYK